MAIFPNLDTGNHSKRIHNGFTLLELLIALAIFVVLATMAYQGLANMLKTRDILEDRAKTLREMQMILMVLGNDLEQAVARTVMLESGQLESAFLGGEQTERFLVMTTAGRPNPLGDTRSEMQRVAWLFVEGTLVRRSWKQLDALGTNPSTDETMARGILNLEVVFWDEGGGKFPTWPKETNKSTLQDLLPKAVEVTMEKRGVGHIHRIFELPGFPRWL
ncbi:MAG: type II secretion system minor pseudopilin GspJ [Magnetococcales bacterium]|nr:type II secretion system minor pseudopilin GspJ [Magnetococcales bacterium]